MQSLHIFKPGKHTAMNGAVLAFTEANLAATAQAYDPAKHEAPIVVGHPAADAPAYGWVKSLAFSEARLEAEPDQVDPAFAELVKNGRFKKISASFYTPDAPNNPVPGVYYLRHVGFLGAQPPAVKGLKQASFAASAEGVIEFADWGDMQNASLWRRMREFLISKFGLDDADKIIPDYAVQSLEDDARAGTGDPGVSAVPGVSYADPKQPHPTQGLNMNAEQLAALQADHDKLKKTAADQATQLAQFAERDRATATAAAQRARAESAAFADGLVKTGQLLPKDRDAVIALLGGFPADAVLEFGEGDKKTSQPTAAWFKEFLGRQPKQVDFGERGRGNVRREDGEPDASELAGEAAAFMEAESKAGRNISSAEAVAHIARKREQV
jgi:hypothetical protein